MLCTTLPQEPIESFFGLIKLNAYTREVGIYNTQKPNNSFFKFFAKLDAMFQNTKKWYALLITSLLNIKMHINKFKYYFYNIGYPTKKANYLLYICMI